MMSDIVRDGPLQVRVRSDGKVLWINDESGACVFRAFVHSGKVEIVDERLQSESVFGILSDPVQVTDAMVDDAIAKFLNDPEWTRGIGIDDKRRRMRAALTALNLHQASLKELSGEQAISAIEALNSAGYIISRRERDE